MTMYKVICKSTEVSYCEIEVDSDWPPGTIGFENLAIEKANCLGSWDQALDGHIEIVKTERI
jgi:hypothetical protein